MVRRRGGTTYVAPSTPLNHRRHSLKHVVGSRCAWVGRPTVRNCTILMSGFLLLSFHLIRIPNRQPGVAEASWWDSMVATIHQDLGKNIVDEFKNSVLMSTGMHGGHSSVLASLEKLTYTAQTSTCPRNQVWINNRLRSDVESTADTPLARGTHKIPRIVHQTGKSRCLTPKLARATEKWWSFLDSSHGWSYFYHDDTAVKRLLEDYNNNDDETVYALSAVPNIHLLAKHCLLHGTVRADVWRYVILYLYGGVYADVDSVPTDKFGNVTTTTHGGHGQHLQTIVDDTDDALFLVEQFHLASQWFMAVTPRHPMLRYAIQQSLANVLELPDTGTVPAAVVTGPHALHAAYQSFRRDVGVTVPPATIGTKPVSAGIYRGSENRTVTMLGTAVHQNEYVNRDVLGTMKRREYRKMGMRHFTEDKQFPSNVSCRTALANAEAVLVQ